jgi:gliding motility-associated-like protein
LSCIDCKSPAASPDQTTTYVVHGTNSIGCTAADSVVVSVVQPFDIVIDGRDSICIGESTQLVATGADRYEWSPSIGLSATNIAAPVASPTFTVPYRIIGYDRYNCFSDTVSLVLGVGNYPEVNLGTGSTIVAGTPVRFQPIVTNGPIMRYTWTPNTHFSCNDCPNPVTPVNNNTAYKLEAENIYGCKGSDTIEYKVFCEFAQVFVATAFSPDADGINDKLVIRGKGISRVNYFRVFNRWGQLVFERNNIGVNDIANGWDGMINGKPAQPDVYVYTASVECTAGSSFVYKGNTTLIR